MKKIAVINQKGGVGKTTITTNLAGVISMDLKQKVLVVDCDAQANTSDYLMATMNMQCQKTLTDLLNKKEKAVEISKDPSKIKKYLYPVKIAKKNRVYNTPITLLPTDEEFDKAEVEDIEILKKILKPLEDQFDYCFFDCSPQKMQGAMIALAAADYILVPLIADVDSLKGYFMILNLVEDMKRNGLCETLQILGVVFNNYRKCNVFEQIAEGVYGAMDNVVFQTKIRSNICVPNARAEGLLLNLYGYEARPIVEDFRNLAKEMIERMTEMEGKVGK